MIVLSFSGKAGAGKDSAANALMAQMTADGLRVRRISFAGKLKDACVTLYGWDRDKLESDPYYKEGGLGGWVLKGKPGMKPVADSVLKTWKPVSEWKEPDYTEIDGPFVPNDWVELDTDPACVALGMTRRVIMQKVGTECFRDQIHADHWVLLVQAAIDRGEFDDVDVGFITDARFRNELQFARDNNGLNIMIQRADEGTLTQHTAHASEQEWQQQTSWDVILTNNIAAGLDELKRTVVRTVYTAMVQGTMKVFPFPIQKALVDGSLFGLAANQVVIMNGSIPKVDDQRPEEVPKAPENVVRFGPDREPIKTPYSPLSVAMARAKVAIDEARDEMAEPDFIRDVVEPSGTDIETALRRHITYRNRGGQ